MTLLAALIAVAVAQDPVPEALEPELRAWRLEDGLRPQLEAVQAARFRRTTRSNTAWLAVAALEVGAGIVTVVATEGDLGGATVVMGGAAQGVLAYGGLLQAKRKKDAFFDRLASLDGRLDDPEVLRALAEDARLDAEREARRHAFGAGVGLGLLGAGVGLVVLGDPEIDAADVGLAAMATGLTVSVHHLGRWRATTRAAHDLSVVGQGIPTPLR